MSNQKLQLSDALEDQKEAARASSISESQEEGTIIDTGHHSGAGAGEVFVGNGEFGETERDSINVAGKKSTLFDLTIKVLMHYCLLTYFSCN